MARRVYRSKSFKNWYKMLTEKNQAIIDTRIGFYVEFGELVQSKMLDSKYSLYEFKWHSGLRVYYSLMQDREGQLILLLIGGNKNSQTKDISEAKSIVLKAMIRIEEKNEHP